MAKRFALKIAYDGRAFFGSQIQPGVPTVAGELTKVLSKSGFISPSEKLQFASRTDRGVSALCNIASYSGKKPVLGKINHHLPPEISVWGFCEVPEDFNPRHSERKTYLYFLPNMGQDENLLRRALGYFVGLRDFKNFSKKDEKNWPGEKPKEKGTEIILEEATLSRIPGFFLMKFTAPKFLWMQIRRIVGAAESVCDGKMNLTLLEELLSGKVKGSVPSAPPEGLILCDVEYADLKFQDFPKNLKERFSDRALFARRGAGVLSVLSGSEWL